MALTASELYRKTCTSKKTFNRMKHNVDTKYHYKCPYCRNYHVTSLESHGFDDDENLVMRTKKEVLARIMYGKYLKFISNPKKLALENNDDNWEIWIK